MKLAVISNWDAKIRQARGRVSDTELESVLLHSLYLDICVRRNANAIIKECID